MEALATSPSIMRHHARDVTVPSGGDIPPMAFEVRKRAGNKRSQPLTRKNCDEAPLP